MSYIGSQTKNRFHFKEALCGLGGLVFFLVLLLITIGTFFIYSASGWGIESEIVNASQKEMTQNYNKRVQKNYAIKQVIWALVGVAVSFIIFLIDYKWLLKHAFLFTQEQYYYSL